MASWTRFSLIVAPAVVHLACRDGYVIIDNWGPPAGYAAVQGTVRDASGSSYRVDGSLPPVGVLPRSMLDTLRIHCDIFLGAPGAAAAVDTITPRFAPSRDSVVPSVRDLLLP